MDVHIHALDEPLKSIALDAAAGSLQGMKNLFKHLSSLDVLERSEVVPIAKATLAGLSFSSIPRSTSALKHGDIERATLSISCIALLVKFDGLSEEASTSFLLREQEKIFPWIHFLLVRDDSLLDTTPWAPGLPMALVICIIFGFLNRVGPVHSLNVHTSNTIVEVWSRLQAIPIEGPMLPVLAEAVNDLVTSLVRYSLGKESTGDFVERLGGISSIPVLYAASLEKYLHSVSLSEPAEGSRILVLILQNTSILMSLFLDNLLPYTILSEDTIRQITRSIKHLVENHSQINPSFTRQFDAARAAYFRFIFDCPTTTAYYPILHMLQLGIAEHVRIIESNISVVELVGRLLVFYAKFPAVLPSLEQFVGLPTNPLTLAAWDSTDDSIMAYISIWLESRAEAKRYTGCTNCHKPAPKRCPLKVCAACGISRYCSAKCQRTDWNFGHRWLCEIYRLCGTASPLIRTNNPTSLIYLSKLEEKRGLTSRADEFAQVLNQSPPISPAELPLLHYHFDLQLEDDIKFKRFQDYPELFDNEKIREVVVPRIKDFISMKEIPEYLTILALHINEGVMRILSPSMALIISDLAANRRRGAQRDHTH